MTSPDATAQAIAGRLSKAQRAALLWLPADGQPRLYWSAPTGTIAALLRMRLAARWTVRRSVEDARRIGDASWQPDEPHCVHDAYSLTAPKHGRGATVWKTADGQAVRAILAAERDGGEVG